MKGKKGRRMNGKEGRRMKKKEEEEEEGFVSLDANLFPTLNRTIMAFIY